MGFCESAQHPEERCGSGERRGTPLNSLQVETPRYYGVATAHSRDAWMLRKIHVHGWSAKGQPRPVAVDEVGVNATCATSAEEGAAWARESATFAGHYHHHLTEGASYDCVLIPVDTVYRVAKVSQACDFGKTIDFRTNTVAAAGTPEP